VQTNTPSPSLVTPQVRFSQTPSPLPLYPRVRFVPPLPPFFHFSQPAVLLKNLHGSAPLVVNAFFELQFSPLSFSTQFATHPLEFASLATNPNPRLTGSLYFLTRHDLEASFAPLSYRCFFSSLIRLRINPLRNSPPGKQPELQRDRYKFLHPFLPPLFYTRLSPLFPLDIVISMDDASTHQSFLCGLISILDKRLSSPHLSHAGLFFPSLFVSSMIGGRCFLYSSSVFLLPLVG